MGSKDLETFEVGPFLEELSQHLLEGAGDRGVTLTVEAPPLRVGLDFAIPLGLLVTELVTNSIKHGFPEGRGAIDVRLEEADGEVLLLVRDDGVGYDPAAPRPATLGGRIVDGLVRQLGATLTVAVDGGVHTSVRIPPGGRG